MRLIFENRTARVVYTETGYLVWIDKVAGRSYRSLRTWKHFVSADRDCSASHNWEPVLDEHRNTM
jgi:hypothetical protein